MPNPRVKTVSIIICTRNRAERIRLTLKTLGSVVRDDVKVEIVLIDNASSDNTHNILKDFAATRRPGGVRILMEPTPGKSLALNRGARESTGDILVWLDDDVVPEPGWLDNLVRPIREGTADLVVGRISIPSYLLRDWLTPELRERYGEIPGFYGGTFPVGGNTAATRELWEKSGGHDTHLGPGIKGPANGEDTLFAHVLISLGARLGYAGDAAVEHHFDSRRLQRQDWLNTAESQGRSTAYIFHHWDHGTTPMPLIRQWRKQWQLFWWRLSNRPNLDPQSEGITSKELDYVMKIGFFNQYWIESRIPHRYKKRGLL